MYRMRLSDSLRKKIFHKKEKNGIKACASVVLIKELLIKKKNKQNTSFVL